MNINKQIRQCFALLVVASLAVACGKEEHITSPQTAVQEGNYRYAGTMNLDLNLDLNLQVVDEGDVLGEDVSDKPRAGITLSRSGAKFVSSFNTQSHAHGEMKAVVAIKDLKQAGTYFLTQVDVKPVESADNKAFKIKQTQAKVYRLTSSGYNHESQGLPKLTTSQRDRYAVKIYLGGLLKNVNGKLNIVYGTDNGGFDGQTINAVAPMTPQIYHNPSDTQVVDFTNAYGNVPFVNSEWFPIESGPAGISNINSNHSMQPIRLQPRGTMMRIIINNEGSYNYKINNMMLFSSAVWDKFGYRYEGGDSFKVDVLQGGWVDNKIMSFQEELSSSGKMAIYFWVKTPEETTIGLDAHTSVLANMTRKTTDNKYTREVIYPLFANIGKLRGIKEGRVASTTIKINNSTPIHPITRISPLYAWRMGSYIYLRQGDVGLAGWQTEAAMESIAGQRTKERHRLFWSNQQCIEYERATNFAPFDVAIPTLNASTGEIINSNLGNLDTYYFPELMELYGVFPYTPYDAVYRTDVPGEAQTADARWKGLATKTYLTIKEKIPFRKTDNTMDRLDMTSIYYFDRDQKIIYALRHLKPMGNDRYATTPYTSAFRYEWHDTWSEVDRYYDENFTTAGADRKYSRLSIRVRLLGGFNQYNEQKQPTYSRVAPSASEFGIQDLANAITKESWWNDSPVKDYDIKRSYPATGYYYYWSSTSWRDRSCAQIFLMGRYSEAGDKVNDGENYSRKLIISKPTANNAPFGMNQRDRSGYEMYYHGVLLPMRTP